MLDHLLESSYWNDFNKWSNIQFGEEIMQAVWIEVNFINRIWSTVILDVNCCLYCESYVQSNLFWKFAAVYEVFNGRTLF